MHLPLPAHNIRYSGGKSQVFAIFLQLPGYILSLVREYFRIRKFHHKYHFDLVISDNRYGILIPDSYNIFITHQVQSIFPKSVKALSGILHSIQHKMTNKFDELWVPDDKTNLNISGILSDSTKNSNKIHEIGLLSRFYGSSAKEMNNYKYDLLIILSGPEPQRTILEKKLFRQLHNTDLKVLLIRGTFSTLTVKPSTLEVSSHMDSKSLGQTICSSRMILCRSGYSSIMDLIRLRKQALLIPTPGQTEQEYLAGWMKERGFFYTVCQDNVQIYQDIQTAASYVPPKEVDLKRPEKRLEKVAKLVQE